ncbi:hypothetical protein GRF29_216g695250 [Pseudopithomyces chartarum]|uniref:Uncharacterized protein n=1 Tax=Pseudopithomyces chartarum TaxID=1892770 RepID=A0AAN6LQW3_9PLEO|nr:hypothetical protein GRF29_216g695250 [Pseudopithomyces chartarum]
MQNPSGSETPDNPAKPFHDAAYRRWEQEFERDPAKKPLPPLPRVPLPVQQSGDRFVGRLPAKREEHASSPVRQPQPTVFKSQRNDSVSVEDEDGVERTSNAGRSTFQELVDPDISE